MGSKKKPELSLFAHISFSNTSRHGSAWFGNPNVL